MLQIPFLIYDGDDWNVVLQTDQWDKLARDLVAALHRSTAFPHEIHSWVAEALAENGIVPDTIASHIEVNLPEAIRPYRVAHALAPVPDEVMASFAKLANP